MHEVVALDPGEGDGEVRLVELGRARIRPLDGEGVSFPAAPGLGGLGLDLGVGVGQAAVIGAYQVAALGGRDRGQEPLPRIGKDHRGPVLIEPGQFALGQQEDAPQHQRRDPLRMGGGIGQRQGGSPRAAKHRPLVNAGPDAQGLDVFDQRPGRVVVERGIGPRLATAALVEQHHPPLCRIKEPPHGRVDRPPRPSVQDHARLTVRVAAFLEVNLVPVLGLEPALVEGLVLGKKGAAGAGAGDHHNP